MTEVRSHRSIPAPADAVWRHVRTFPGGEGYTDMIERATVDGEGVGATREIVFVDGTREVQRVEALDDAARTLRYTMVSSTTPVEDLDAVMRVVADSEGACTIEWSATFETAPEHADEVQAVVQALFDEVLEHYARLGPPEEAA